MTQFVSHQDVVVHELGHALMGEICSFPATYMAWPTVEELDGRLVIDVELDGVCGTAIPDLFVSSVTATGKRQLHVMPGLKTEAREVTIAGVVAECLMADRVVDRDGIIAAMNDITNRGDRERFQATCVDDESVDDAMLEAALSCAELLRPQLPILRAGSPRVAAYLRERAPDTLSWAEVALVLADRAPKVAPRCVEI